MFFRRFFLSDVDGLLYGGQLRFGNSQVRVENLPYVMLQVELKHLPCCCSAFRRGRAEHTTPASGWGGSTDVDVVGCFSTTGLTSEKPEPSIGHTYERVSQEQRSMCAESCTYIFSRYTYHFFSFFLSFIYVYLAMYRMNHNTNTLFFFLF